VEVKVIHVQTPQNKVINQLNVGNVRPPDQEKVHNCNFECVTVSVFCRKNTSNVVTYFRQTTKYNIRDPLTLYSIKLT
jgi:hypothetical protein